MRTNRACVIVALSINSLVSAVWRTDFWVVRAVRAAGHFSDRLDKGINRATRMSQRQDRGEIEEDRELVGSRMRVDSRLEGEIRLIRSFGSLVVNWED